MNLSKSAGISGKGYLFVLMAAVLWAAAATGSKFLFSTGMSPFQLVQLRITISAGVFFLWLLIRKPCLMRISRKDILYFVMLGAVGMATMQSSYLFAISKINVAAAILLQYLAPVLIVLYSVTVTRETLGLMTGIAVGGTTAGCYLVVGAYNLDLLHMNFQGIVSGVVSAVAFAWYTVKSEYGMRRYHPWTVLFFAMVFACLSWNIFHPPLEAFMHAYSPAAWMWILFIALPGTLLPFGFYFKGIYLIRATHASITATFEPIAAGIISYLFLNEVMKPLQVVGAVMVIAAIILLQIAHRPEGNLLSGPKKHVYPIDASTEK
ncbi:MAG: DMT family transporter [Desulfobacterales bacterium]|nr:DMT family transporter [Desulfobacterales bacterium]MDD4073244.1 DMT family transporter [Desulfobacterales bacterium]MDD4391379.1 DMT family transporter [Desulfobacterales bacterium]